MKNHRDPLVRLSGDRLITTSLAISQHFGKKHTHVLRDIKNLECSKEFAESNFGLCSYTDGNQRQRPMYEITRDGFVFLCMGFTGPAAAKWKERYIAAFNALEEKVRGGLAVPQPIDANLAALRREALRANPAWRNIARYKGLGLSNVETGKLLGLHESTIRRHLRRMEACGLIAPPADLARLQAQARRLEGGAA